MNKKIIAGIATVLIVGIGLFWYSNHRRSDLKDELRESLTGEKSGVLSQSKFSAQIQAFYANREYLEVWLFNGSLSNSGEELLEQIENSKYDGLQPVDYSLEEINALSSDPEKENKKFRNLSTDEMLSLELMLSDAFLTLAHDLENGKVNPASLDPNWKFEKKESKIDYLHLLTEIGAGRSVEHTLQELYPHSELYARGREAIEELYQIQANDTLAWEFAQVEGAIEVGEMHAAIPALRKRLMFWGFLEPYEIKEATLFDSIMFAGLQDYQKSNGMKPDGIIGTLAAESLNKSPQDLIDIAAVNMERLRWMPKMDWDQEMVLVNIANYQLDYMHHLDTAFTAKVIVGKEYNESPTFTAPMSYIVFSPYWNIPESITNDEIIPSINKNPDYLSQKNMEVVSGSGEVVKASKVNLSKDQGYRVRQKPGGDNSLGLVKFMFPNDYNIYIHDTPARSLFAKETRALSHGCIRIQNPDQFAKILLDDKEWDDEKIQKAMHQENEEVVELDRKIPVVLLYMTFWADKDGKANFRSDVYDRDSALLKALRSQKSSLDQA
ncbi:L,D-transpeptidase family protein [Algoriphagus halophytocola]|uniref:L,D-transpeptidase family protein n=1 Tax=Algoriphagus halophytocola TaxID=2991499 RepID=A0ABY6MKB7_9BACT|nr:MULTISPECIES: L,D-transpeptidase family protein [unclassified Algoriphagus]UZD24218.1 L,D-transpeptidase family protein [Algoriphagus sp. TR-M5]WBL41587.1 L,D-transpeptidase family protein [Algoriphagus sp. TR-M9]